MTYSNDITIAITSCGRIDLLEKTISSIAKTINLSSYKKILTEDAKNEEHIKKMKEANKNWFLKWWKILFTWGSNQKDLYKCHHYALKTLYDNIDTKYVFHCEDDQIFKKTDFDYFKLSYDILENNKEIWIVLLRDMFKDFWLKKTWIMKSRYYEILTDHEIKLYGHNFIYLSDSNAFTLQPGLRRLKEMKEVMFGFEDYVDEKLIWERYCKKWYKTIVINPGIFNHINPVFNTTKNIRNLWLFKYIYETLKWTIAYRWWLIIKYIKSLLKGNK